MNRRNRTPYSILGCLTVRPMSGYDVKQFLERTVVHFWSESPGQIYPALRTLEKRGLVEGRSEPGERGQEKRVYRITKAGRQELRTWLREPAEPTRQRYEHTLKLFFGHGAGPETSLAHVERLRRQTKESLARYRERERELEERARREPASHAPYWLVVLRGGIRYSEMVLDWCSESAETLRSLSEAAAGGRMRGSPCAVEEDGE